MKNIKELIKRKKFLTLFLSLFITISGLLVFMSGLLMFVITADRTFIPIAISIFGTILTFIGYIIPKSIIKISHDEENKRQQQCNEKKDIIKNLREIKLASDIEKQDYIIEKKLKSSISFPILLTIGIIFWIGAIFIIVSFIKNKKASFLLFVGICFLVLGTIICYINKNKNKNFIQKFMNSNIYIAGCYAYDRKTETIRVVDTTGSNFYTLHLIKITDGNYFIDKWFSINYDRFYNDIINVKLYISDEMDIYDIM